jgi:hypothetical protein
MSDSGQDELAAVVCTVLNLLFLVRAGLHEASREARQVNKLHAGSEA